MLQSTAWSADPQEGAGLLQSLVFLWLPPPQEALHDPSLDQTPQPPSTAAKKIFARFAIFEIFRSYHSSGGCTSCPGNHLLGKVFHQERVAGCHRIALWSWNLLREQWCLPRWNLRDNKIRSREQDIGKIRLDNKSRTFHHLHTSDCTSRSQTKRPMPRLWLREHIFKLQKNMWNVKTIGTYQMLCLYLFQWYHFAALLRGTRVRLILLQPRRQWSATKQWCRLWEGSSVFSTLAADSSLGLLNPK